MATLYKVDGTKLSIELEADDSKRLRQLQQLVGGYIQLVPLGDTGTQLVCNENGLIENLPTNVHITPLCVGLVLMTHGGIRGDALIATDAELREDDYE